jgi:transposase-like protein
MRIQRKYPIEIEERVVKEYLQGNGGYKKLAKRYHMTRDLVRGWVLKSIKKRSSKVIKNDEFKSLEEEVAYLRDAHLYWKTYARILAEDNPEGKKKAEEFARSQNVLNKDHQS